MEYASSLWSRQAGNFGEGPHSLHILLTYECILLTYRLAFRPFCRWLNTDEIRECFDC